MTTVDRGGRVPPCGSIREEGRRTASARSASTSPSASMLRAMSQDLVRRMIEASELHGDFVLSSGRRSAVYFDKFLFLTDPALLDELSIEVARKVPPGVDRLGAPEGAAMLLVSAVALKTGLPISVVRKEPKAYGTM